MTAKDEAGAGAIGAAPKMAQCSARGIGGRRSRAGVGAARGSGRNMGAASDTIRERGGLSVGQAKER
jgi:hypothetical protein